MAMTCKSFIHFLMRQRWALTLCAFSGYVLRMLATFTTFDPAGAFETFPYSINASGAITGFYITSDDKGHGFVSVDAARSRPSGGMDRS